MSKELPVFLSENLSRRRFIQIAGAAMVAGSAALANITEVVASKATLVKRPQNTKQTLWEKYQVEAISYPEFLDQTKEICEFDWIQELPDLIGVGYNACYDTPDWDEDTLHLSLASIKHSPPYLTVPHPAGHLRLVSSFDNRISNIIDPFKRNFVQLGHSSYNLENPKQAFLIWLHELYHRNDPIESEGTTLIAAADKKEDRKRAEEQHDEETISSEEEKATNPLKEKIIPPLLTMSSAWHRKIYQILGECSFSKPPEHLASWASTRVEDFIKLGLPPEDFLEDPDYFQRRLVYGIRRNFPVEWVAVMGELAASGRGFFREGLEQTHLFSIRQIERLEDFSYDILLAGMDPKDLLINR